MTAIEPSSGPHSGESRFVIYRQPSLIIEALRKAIEKRAPEFVFVPAEDAGEAAGRADLILIPIAADEAGDVDSLLRPFAAAIAAQPDLPVVAVLPNADARMASRLIAHKVSGLITADSSIDATMAAMRYALAGGRFAPSSLWRADRDMAPAAAAPLTLRAETLELASHQETSFTPREIEVLHRLRQGLQNKIIAYELGISESTVKVHLRNVMKKLHASNRTQVAFMLRRLPHLNSGNGASRELSTL